MGYTPHFNGEASTRCFLDRHMFLFGCVDCVLDEQLHGLATTNKFTLAGVQHFNNIATNFALVNLEHL
jgi:hypothetical protein